MPKKTSPKNTFPRPADQRQEKEWKLLNRVIDPELGIGIVDLGLVYDLKVQKDLITVVMTLTSPGCPVAPIILQDIETTLLAFNPKLKGVQTEIVWEPVWTHQSMDPDLRDMMLGL